MATQRIVGRHSLRLLVASLVGNGILLIFWLWDVEPGGELRRSELGDIGTWVGGIGSAAAVIIAVLALKHESEARTGEALRGIGAWVYYVAEEEPTNMAGLPQGFSGLYLALQNLTSNPVFAFRVRLLRNGTVLLAVAENIWPPGKVLARALTIGDEQWEGMAAQDAPLLTEVEIEFREVSGARWRIAPGHGLQRA